MIGDRVDDLALSIPSRDDVEILRADRVPARLAGPQQLQSPHAEGACRPGGHAREGCQADEQAARIPDREKRELPPFPEDLPPAREPGPRQRHRAAAAHGQEGIPLRPQRRERGIRAQAFDGQRRGTTARRARGASARTQAILDSSGPSILLAPPYDYVPFRWPGEGNPERGGTQERPPTCWRGMSSTTT